MPWGPLPGVVTPAGPYLQGGGGVAPAAGSTGGAPGTTGGTGGTRGGAGTGGTGGAGGTGGGPGGTSAPTPVVTLPADRGQVVVFTPADAKLFAEGQATTLTGTQRVFM